jgi:hypothetical protein
MSAPRNTLRIVLLAAAAGLLAVAASVLREKKATVDLTTQQIEDAISALVLTLIENDQCCSSKVTTLACSG